MATAVSIEAERFKQVRKELRYTQQAFAEVLGIPSSTADIERGKTKVPGHVVFQLMKQFQVNPLWLFGESNAEKVLPPAKVAHSFMPKVVTVNSQEQDNIVLVNQKAAAGYPHNVQDASWYERLPAFDFPLPQYRNATYRGFQVEGDSMLPHIHPGDWVIGKAVSTPQEIINNRVYVVVLQDSVLVKKVQMLPDTSKVVLLSYNENYPPVSVPFREIQEIWLVNSKLTFGLENASESYLLRELQASMRDLKEQLQRVDSR